jgi:glycosyltransferase involved in cell wall biosynthesis
MHQSDDNITVDMVIPAVPKISVIIPVYNTEEYLENCLNSLIKQTMQDFEVICVNDGSSDGSGVILEQFKRLDPRFMVISQDNRGQSSARNKGMAHARGEYIYFLDSDDAIHPQLLEITYFFAEKFNADMVCFKNDSELKKKSSVSLHVKTYANFSDISFRLTANPLLGFKKTKRFRWKMDYGPYCKLLKRELLNGIEFIEGHYFEDIAHTLLICKKHPKTVLLDEVLYFYTYRDTSTMGQAKNINTNNIKDYHYILSAVYEAYRTAPKGELDFIAKEIVFLSLKHQLKKINREDIQKQKELYYVFIEELTDLNSKGLIRFEWALSSIRYWLKFKGLIKKGNR